MTYAKDEEVDVGDVEGQRANAENEEVDVKASISMQGLVELTQGQEAALGDFCGAD